MYTDAVELVISYLYTEKRECMTGIYIHILVLVYLSYLYIY